MPDPLTIVLIVLWFLIVLINARSFYDTHIRRRFASSIPIIGGLLGAVGCYQIPSLRKWCWVPVLLDYGSITFLLALPRVVRELWQTSRLNLVHEFTGKDHHKEVKIRLYKAGVFTLKHQFARPKRSAGLLTASRIGSWSATDGTIVLTDGEDSLTLQPLGETWKVNRSTSHYRNDSELAIAHLEFQETR